MNEKRHEETENKVVQVNLDDLRNEKKYDGLRETVASMNIEEILVLQNLIIREVNGRNCGVKIKDIDIVNEWM